jgi:hypothetical protein
MISLEQQLKMPEKLPIEVLTSIYESLGVEERGGGVEGIYYTHPLVEGEFLFRNLPLLVTQVIISQSKLSGA